MNWQKEPPTEPGWYWYREVTNTAPRAVKVFEWESDLVIINEFMPRGCLPIQRTLGEWWPTRIQEPEA